MKVRQILFATDLSPASLSALDYATALARDYVAKLLIVHVEAPLAYGGGNAYLPEPMEVEEDIERRLAAVIPTTPGVPHEHLLLAGDPGEELVRVARERDVDLIVMSTHGRKGLSRLLMGSVAEAVMRRAPCPVLTVKPTADHARQSKERNTDGHPTQV